MLKNKFNFIIYQIRTNINNCSYMYLLAECDYEHILVILLWLKGMLESIIDCQTGKISHLVIVTKQFFHCNSIVLLDAIKF